jgi:hypothetical protein
MLVYTGEGRARMLYRITTTWALCQLCPWRKQQQQSIVFWVAAASSRCCSCCKTAACNWHASPFVAHFNAIKIRNRLDGHTDQILAALLRAESRKFGHHEKDHEQDQYSVTYYT